MAGSLESVMTEKRTCALYVLGVFCLGVSLVLPESAAWAAGQRHVGTLPVTTSAMANQAAAQPGHPSHGPSGTTASSHASSSRAKPSRGVTKGFQSNPFGLEHRKPDAGDKNAKGRVSYGAEGQRVEHPVVAPGTLSVTGRKDSVPDDRLRPHRTSTFPGGPQTLSTMDHDPPPEVSMSYRMDENTSTRLTVNPQDPTSPLYRPAETEGKINAAGAYLNVDVQPDLQLQIGGEYCEVETRSSGEDSSSGASVGLRWNF